MRVLSVLLISLAFFLSCSNSNSSDTVNSIDKEREKKDNLESESEILEQNYSDEKAKEVKQNYEKYFLIEENCVIRSIGGISGTMSIHNTSDYKINVIVITMSIYKEYGGLYDEMLFQFKDVAPDEIEFKEIKPTSRGIKYDCEITYVKCDEIGLEEGYPIE